MSALELAAPAGAAIPSFWRTLAHCETGEHWDWGAQHRPGEGPEFEGGLGFYASTWSVWRKQVGVPYPHAWQAPPGDQVRVAAWGLAHGGYWGCLRQVPRTIWPAWTPRWLDVEWV